MKKIFNILFIALALFATACAEVVEPEQPQDPGTTETPETPETPDQPTPDDGTIEFIANVPVKTAIDADDVKVTWCKDDAVKFIWAGGECTALATAEGETTTFKVPVEDGVEEIYAVYPATMPATLAEGKLVLGFANTLESGAFAANDVTVSKTQKVEGEWNTTLNFKNAASLFKVGVTNSATTRVQIASYSDEIVAGDLTVSFAEDGTLAFEYPAEGNTTMNMAINGVGDYYIPVFPGVTMENGFRINRFEGEDNQMTPFYYRGEFTTERGAIYRFPNLEYNAGRYYVANAGTGVGHKSSEPMNVEDFKAFVTNQVNFFLLRGATFHFAAEEFSFGDDYLVFDYSEHSVVNLTLEGTVDGDNMTVFKGRETEESNKAGVLWPQTNSDVTVKNVKFTGTDGASNSAAVRINNGAKKVTFENCVFDGNKTTGNGAAIIVFNSAELLVKGCTFTGNSGSGACIFVENNSAKVRVENSTFRECSQTSNAIRIKKAASFELIDSEISDNYSYATIYTTGDFVGSFLAERVVWKNNHAYDDLGSCGWYESTSEYKFVDCEFIDNKADWGGGALMFVKAHAILEGCTFQGNHADGDNDTDAAGGAIYAKGSGVVVDCKDCTFKENYNFVGTNTKSGGIIRVEQSGGIARFDNCVFDGNYTNRSVQNNAASAAIINCRKGGAIYYFNACEFKGNSSGLGYSSDNEQGGTKGTVIASYASSTIAMNNCSMHDNYGARNSDEISWIYVDNASNTLLISNSTIVGDPTRCNGNRKNAWGVLKLHTAGNYHLINNILCSMSPDDEEAQTVWCGTTLSVNSYYNKTTKDADGRIDWGADTGSGHDYFATSDYFGGWTLPYTWNGTLIGTNSDKLAATSDVNTQLQSANSDFYNWLDSIGALGKDINGNNRGATSWPGCYQAN